MKKKSRLFKKNRLFQLSITLIVLAILSVFYLFCVESMVDETIFYRINPGVNISSVALDMQNQGLVKSDKMLKASIIMQGNRAQSGEYELHRGASIWKIARMFNKGRIASTMVVIPEGLTVKQIKKLLLDTDTLVGDVECKSVPATPGVIVKGDPICGLKDGDLFPDTYRVARGTARLDVLRLSKNKMDSVRATFDGKKYPGPLRNWNEVLTLASIVQKETPKVAEMPTVASVYLNRLKKRMRLQADPTVVYAITDGLGDMQGEPLLSGHLQTASPYNTYTNYGLPPAPIANVGRNAIAAVLDPADTTYLYFVADGQGGHKFSKNYEEHKKNHADWRQIKKSLNSKK